MPPAVEVVPPPMIIRQIVISVEASVMAAVSVVLNPAVRVVTAWNQPTVRRAAVDSCWASVPGLFHSSRQKAITENAISPAVPVSMIFVCSV